MSTALSPVTLIFLYDTRQSGRQVWLSSHRNKTGSADDDEGCSGPQPFDEGAEADEGVLGWLGFNLWRWWSGVPGKAKAVLHWHPSNVYEWRENLCPWAGVQSGTAIVEDLAE